ncbi:MAG: hypothetical protein K0U98_11450 [Deltaproteobacteria bacterium]|nr:hypothetical protein [Deltaproteobacteria bacterium]
MSIKLHSFDNREDWALARSLTLGGSDIRDLVVSQYPEECTKTTRSWLSLWVEKCPEAREELEKAGRWPIEEKHTVNFQSRLSLEPVIAEMVAKRHDVAVIDPGDAILVNSDLPGVHYSPDGFIGIPGEVEPVGVEHSGLSGSDALGLADGLTEYKTIHPFMADTWADGPPLGVEVQVQSGLWISGYDHAILGAFVGYGDDPKRDQLSWEIEPDERLISEIAELVERFRVCVERGEEPTPCGLDSTLDAIRLLRPARPSKPRVEVTLGTEVRERFLAYNSLKDRVESLDRELAREKAEIEEAMSQAGATLGIVPAHPDLLPDGGKIYRYATKNGSTTLRIGRRAL